MKGRGTGTGTKAAALIKPYLKKLVLQTHPDFFHGDPIKGKRNATSLQQLYTILNPLLKNEPLTTKSQSTFQWTKNNEQSVQLEFYAKKARKTPIVSTFEHAPNEWQTVASLFSLCKKLDIDVAPSDIQAVQDMIQKKEQETTPHRHRRGRLSLREEFARALHKQSSTITKDTSTTSSPWTPNRILGNKSLIFGPQIDKSMVAKQWCEFMSKLEPERWWGIMPALVVSSENDAQNLSSSEQGRGILVFSSDMGYDDFVIPFFTSFLYIIIEMKTYLEKNLDIKRQERVSMMS
ncbi:hypothetical protein BDA99DRAFT_24026 [Phascolomyces articulosus]|uniref:DUF4460 domain-containing protein n=1 Tax=Phascolomyces articulosus TaxID=60185 RepID=A0AAD5PF42_9FUNG|nr:hypothetical protein BDA99DRAFT_24026 [Phascolomyces articulosus]